MDQRAPGGHARTNGSMAQTTGSWLCDLDLGFELELAAGALGRRAHALGSVFELYFAWLESTLHLVLKLEFLGEQRLEES